MELDQLRTAIEAQERLRGIVPDDVIDATVAALEAQHEAALGQRRRQVTVLFADVSGFTALSESLDAEVVAEIMNGLWERLDKVVVEHGGRVDKHIGDALMAVWGTGATAEDDAEQAVRAALRLQTELKQFRSASGRAMSMRVGVNTGPVLVGAVGSTDEFTVMGDTVNTASRLEHAAPPDRVLMSHDTYRQVRGVFDVETMEPLVVKGKSDPLLVYMAKLEKPRAFRLRNRGVEGVDTKTIGRQREFGTLCDAFEHVLHSGTGRAALIVGDAGVGKSRLLSELDNWLELHEQSVFYFKARATRARARSRLGVWRDLVAFRCGVGDGDSAVLVFSKLRAETGGTLDDREVRILGLWLGFELPEPPDGSPVVSGENLAAAGKVHLVAFLRSMMERSPVVMLFEDLHWADSASLELLDELSHRLSNERILMVAATRPERPSGPLTADSLGERWTPISLDSLDDEASRELVVEILKRVDDLPGALIDLVVERADGNPFYIEELIKKLIDDGCIIAGPDRWSINADRLDEASVPRTLTGVLQARLDLLSLNAQRSLQCAAVIGRTFWESAVLALRLEEPDLEQAIGKELVFGREPSSFAGTSEFAFKHALLHDVTYDTVLLSDRPDLHRRAAHWLTDAVGGRRDEYLEEIAGHLLAGDEPDRAARLLVEAANRSLNSGDAPSARRLAEAGFEASAAVAADCSGHAVLAKACRLSGDLDRAEIEASTAIQIGDTADDDEAFVAAIHEAFFVSETQGAHDRGRALVAQGLPTAERLGGASFTRMLACKAWSDLNAGDLDEARRAAAHGLSRAEDDRDDAVLIEALKISANIASASGDHDDALTYAQRILDLASATGNLTEVAVGHLNAGVCRHFLADLNGDDDEYARAQADYETALALTRRLSFPAYEAQGLSNLAQLHVRRGRPDAGRTLAKECLAVATAIGAHTHALFALLVHAEATYEMTGSVDALSQIGAVRSDPKLGRLDSEVADVINRLRRAHPVVDIDVCVDKGTALSIHDVVQSVLDS